MSNWREIEQKKYETVWGDYPGYRLQADGDPVVEIAYKTLGCQRDDSLIDWGCGKGTPAARFQDMGLIVTGFDIAHNCLDQGVSVPLVVGCLWEKQHLLADYSFCTDVLEHIPPEHLDAALTTIYDCTRRAAFLQVCTVADTFGRKLMNPPQQLHLSIMDIPAWRDKFVSVGWKVKMSVARGKSRWWALCVK